MVNQDYKVINYNINITMYTRKLRTHETQVSALGGPQRRCSKAKNEGGRNKSVVGWVGLGSAIDSVPDGTKSKGTFDSNFVKKPSGDKERRDDHCGIQNWLRCRANAPVKSNNFWKGKLTSILINPCRSMVLDALGFDCLYFEIKTLFLSIYKKQ